MRKCSKGFFFESLLGMLDCIEVICPKGGVKGTISGLNHQTTINVSIIRIISTLRILSIHVISFHEQDKTLDWHLFVGFFQNIA